MNNIHWILILSFACRISCTKLEKTRAISSKDVYEAEHTRLLDSVFDDVSTSAMRPNFGGEPIIVTCSLTVASFADLSETTMDYSLSLSLYLEWTDKRLVHNSSGEITFQTIETIKKAWLPDVYFLNEKTGIFHDIISENTAFIVYPDGKIIYSIRLTLTLSCFMELYFFPMDRQQCPLLIRSYAYNEKNVILKWRNVDNKTDPIDYSEDIELPQFTLKNVSEDTSVSILRLGNFTTLCARFTLERVMGFYIVHTYLPSFLLVIVSWITFWLHVEATAARASLGITTVLTVTTQVTSSRFTLPDVAYPTALDIWFSCCLVLVFSALLEFAFVNYVNLLDTKIRVPKMKVALTEDQESFEMEKYDTASSHVSGLSPGLQRRNVKNTEAIETSSSVKKGLPGKHRVGRATGIDRTCRILFPALFLTFNICYWSYYLTMRQTVPDHWRVTSCDSK